MTKAVTIEVRADAEQMMIADGRQSNRLQRVFNEMRAKGVPIIGKVGFVGVTHGVFEFAMEEGLNGDEFIYRWTGVPDEDDEL